MNDYPKRKILQPHADGYVEEGSICKFNAMPIVVVVVVITIIAIPNFKVSIRAHTFLSWL